MDYCKFHPNKVAHVRCRTCHIPLCDDCKMVTDLGVFCSEECHEKAEEFQQTVRPDIPRIKRPSIFWLLFKVIVVLAILVAIAVALDIFGILTLPFVDTITALLGL